MLKYKIDQTAFDALDEAHKAFYKQEGETFVLQVEGAADKAKLDEFRANNVELMKKLDSFKDIDLDKVRDLMDKERKIREKELIDKGEFETIFAERTAAMKADYEGKLQAAIQASEKAQNDFNALFTRHEIEGAAGKAFATHKIAPEAQEAIMAQIRAKFSINNGQVVAMNGQQIEAGANGNLTIDEFIAKQPEIFKIQSHGGAGTGGTNDPMRQGQSSQDKIKAGLLAMN